MGTGLIQDIQRLKHDKNILIIAHYYQEAEIQDLADYVGDSLGMAVFAKKMKKPIAVVCGVKFMAETIQAMNPDKKILLPDLNAGCSLADSCTPEVFSYFKSRHPRAKVVMYVNSSLPIKAMSDVIVTSSNAAKIVMQFPKDQELIFGPDQHLGRYVAHRAGRELILFPGSCFVHMSFSAKEMMRLEFEHPDAEIIAHPECPQGVLAEADFIGSTSQMLQHVIDSPARKFIVMTEAGIVHQMTKKCPDKQFLLGPDLNHCACNICPHMKLNTLEKLRDCLVNESPAIMIDPELARRALVPIDRMMDMTNG